MIQLDHHGKPTYHPDATIDEAMGVQKGRCHFSAEGNKDFLICVTAYEPEPCGAVFEAATFRGSSARVRVAFVSDTAFRLTMLPEGVSGVSNPVFHFAENTPVTVTENEEFILVSTRRVELQFRKLPWEMTVLLDGEELTKEQIKDFNCGQRYKSIPLGFARDGEGKVLYAFETMYMYTDEAFYGFGEKFTSFNKRGQKLTVWQRDAESTNSDVSYKAMPYFMSSSGYSILLNTFTRTHFNMGADSGVSYTMETEDPCLDYYVICNRSYRGILEDYTALSGRSRMIPRWAFGFWMSKMSYMSRQELEETVDNMAKFGMSVDVIHIDAWDSFFTGGKTELLTFDEKRFPDPEGMIRNLAEKGIHLSLWMFPYVPVSLSRFASEIPGAAPGESYQFRIMKERGFLVKNRDGEVCTFMPGEGDAGMRVAALDFSNPALVEYMNERIGKLMRMGVGVIKTDFSEEIPEEAVLYDGSTGKEAHNKYPLLYARTIYEASRKAKEEMGQKALLWGRSGYMGSQNYPANWAGDSSAAINNNSALLRGGLSMGLSGVSFWGFDIGGFYTCDYEGQRTLPEDEEYIRSVQLGLMSPLSRSHGQSTPREPWYYSETAQAAFLKINKYRYRLLPYLYSTAYETHYSGVPMMRAMLLEYPEDRNVRDIANQYMLGEAMLVAPVFDRKNHPVYLPEGSWIDLENHRRVAGGWDVRQWPIDAVPRYLRENRGLFMHKNAPEHIADENFKDLTFVMNLTDCLQQRYYDDGVRGEIGAKRSGDTVTVTCDNVPVTQLRIYSDRPVRSVAVNGELWQTVDQGAWVDAMPAACASL